MFCLAGASFFKKGLKDDSFYAAYPTGLLVYVEDRALGADPSRSNVKTGGKLCAEAADDVGTVGSENALRRAAHTKIGYKTGTVRQNLGIVCLNVSVSAENSGYLAVKIVGESCFFGGSLSVNVQKRNIVVANKGW